MGKKKTKGINKTFDNNSDLKFVNINTYKGVKKVIKYMSKGYIYKMSSNYRKNKIKQFESRLKPYLSKKLKMELVADFKKYMGVKKSGKISNKRKKATIRREDTNYLIAIRTKAPKPKKLRAGKKGIGGYGSGGNDWPQIWNDIKAVLDEYGAVAYFADFVSDIYPDWAERAKEAAANMHSFLSGYSGRSFIFLCLELIKKYGW